MTSGEKKIKSKMPLMKYDLRVKCKDPVKDAAKDPLLRPQKDLRWRLTDDPLKTGKGLLRMWGRCSQNPDFLKIERNHEHDFVGIPWKKKKMPLDLQCSTGRNQAGKATQVQTWVIY